MIERTEKPPLAAKPPWLPSHISTSSGGLLLLLLKADKILRTIVIKNIPKTFNFRSKENYIDTNKVKRTIANIALSRYMQLSNRKSIIN